MMNYSLRQITKLRFRTQSELNVREFDEGMATTSYFQCNRLGDGSEWSSLRRWGKSSGTRRSTSSLDTISSKTYYHNRSRKRTVTVQEYFTLTFEKVSDNHRECLPAGKGLQLKEVVAPVFSMRNLSLARFDFFIEGSASPLPLDVETLHLAGSVIIVKSRHKSTSPQPSPQRDESKGVVLRQNKERKQDKRNSAGEKLDRLNDVLSTLSSNYFSNMVTDNSLNFSCDDSCDGDDSVFIKSSWHDVVKDHEKLNKKESAQQSAIWELLTTEVNYMRILKSVNTVYARMLLHLQNREERFLSEIVYDRLFSNIEEVYLANKQLWHQYLSIPVRFSQETGELLNPLLLKDAFIELPTVFKPYINFCLTADACQRYLQHHKENNQMFATFLQWADNQTHNDLGIREGLKAHLTKPMQRLTRYRVILTRIKDETTDPVIREELQEMANIVDEYVSRVNNEVAIKQKTEKLQEIQKKLGHYDCVEPPGEEYNQFVAKYSNFKVKTPMKHNGCLRELIMEGQLKMKEGQGRWTEVYCFLFTDMFLITKATKRSHPDRLKIVKPPMALDKVQAHMLHGPSVSMTLVLLTDFGCLSNIYAFADDTQKLDQWFGKVTETRRLYLSSLGIDDGREDTESCTSPTTRYGRTFSVQSSLASEKDSRRRSSTFGGTSQGSTPALNTAGLDDSLQRQSLSPFNPQHLSRSPLRRPANREASPLARENREAVSGSSPSVVGDVRKTRLAPSSDSSFAPISPKKRASLGAPPPNVSTQVSSVAPVPSVSIAGHTNSLESFPSSSGVSSVDSAHMHSGSELSSSSFVLGVSPVQSGSPGELSTRATPSSISTINGEKMARFTQDSASSLSNGSASDDDELQTCIPRPLMAQTIRVTDKRFSRSLNDLSLQSLSVREASRIAGPVDSPPPLSPGCENAAVCRQKRLAPPIPDQAAKDSNSRRLTGLNPEDMRVYLIEGPDSEATSV